MRFALCAAERVCLVCNHKETKTDPKLDHTHDFGEWKILYEPTVSGPGKLIRVCKEYPDHTQEKSIPTLYRYNNDYEFTIITKPTCTTVGYTTYKCHCGKSYVSDNVFHLNILFQRNNDIN